MSTVDGQRPSEGGRSADGRLMLAATTVLLSLAGAFFLVPLLLVAPVPLAVLVYRDGYRSGTATAVLTLVLVGFTQRRMFAGAPAGLSLDALQSYSMTTMVALITIGLIGMVIGGAWREGASWRQAFWLAVGAAVMPGALVWAAAMVFQGVDLFVTVFDHWMEVVRTVVREAEQSGLSADALGTLEQAVVDAEISFALARPLFPGLIVVGALIGAFVNTSLARLILVRFGNNPPAFVPFVRWRLPWQFALGFILGHALLLLAVVGDNGVAGVVGHNLLIVFNTLFAVQGVAVAWHWFGRRAVALPIRVVLLLIVFWWLPAVPAWTGVLDTWLNFRKLPVAGGGADHAG